MAQATAPTPISTPRLPPATRWPTVIGIIAVIFGLGGVLAYGLGGLLAPLIIGFMADAFRDMAEQQPAMAPTAAQFGAMESIMTMTSIAYIVSGAISAVLLATGIGLLKRRRWSRKCGFSWAAIKCLATIPMTVVGYQINTAQFAAMKEAAVPGPGAMPSTFYGMMESMTIVGVAFGVLWAVAFPIFIVVWFMRDTIRDEMANW